MDIERDTDDDLEDFERLPSGSVITDPRDLKYLRNMRERAQLNRPEPETDTVAAEPSTERLLDQLNDLHEQKAKVIELLRETDARNRDLQTQIANFYTENESNRKYYCRDIQKMLDTLYWSDKAAVRATTAYLQANDDGGRWVRLKVAAAVTGVPLQTLRDWTELGIVRHGRSTQLKGTVVVYLHDVEVQKLLRGR